MISLTHLARMEEARCAIGAGEIADGCMEVGGGLACHGTEPKSWINSAYGLGMGLGLRAGAGPEGLVVGPEPVVSDANPNDEPDESHPWAVRREDVDRMTAWYVGLGFSPKVEVCAHAHPSLLLQLGASGFRPKFWETVFFRSLARDEMVRASVPLSDGIHIRTISPDDERTAREAAWMTNEAFARKGQEVSEAGVEVSMRCIRHPRVVSLGAFGVDTASGRELCVGAGYLEVVSLPGLGTTCALFGAATREGWRRCGVQQALVAARLNLARERGALAATISGVPGAGTERNVRRFGFQVAYAKIHMMKEAQDAQAIR